MSTSNESFIFRGNARDIIIPHSGSYAPLTLTVSSDREQFEALLDPVGGNVIVPLREFLEALDIPSLGFDETCGEVDSVSIVASSGNTEIENLEIYVLPGILGVAQEQAADWLIHNFLTWRPQSCTICKWGWNRLHLAFPKESQIAAQRNVKILLTAYTDNGTEANLEYQTLQCADGSIYAIDCDYSTVDAWLREELPDKDFNEILAYDIKAQWTKDYQTTVNVFAQRFVLARERSDWRQFVFINSLGVYDCIYSRGSLKNVPEFNVKLFRSRNIETEIDNAANDKFEVNTGLIIDELERKQWIEFFSSRERYVFDKGSSALRKIIVDKIKSSQTFRQAGSASFVFHYADPETGRMVERGELPEWDLQSCFGLGRWIGRYPWIKDIGWKNQ